MAPAIAKRQCAKVVPLLVKTDANRYLCIGLFFVNYARAIHLACRNLYLCGVEL